MNTLNINNILGSQKPTCFEIEVHPSNHRKYPNPKFSEIKDSIKTRGILNPLQVVFHPTDKRWLLSHGGQTRLLITRELYNETGEERFLYPPITVGEYTSDLEIAANHLIENSLRGNNSFFEIASGVLKISEIMALEYGAVPTQEDISLQMKKLGMPIRRQSITSMLYAVNVLAPSITNTEFLSKMSRKLIDQIRSLKCELEGSLNDEEFTQELVGLINSYNRLLSFQEIESCLKKKSANSNPTEKAIKSSNDLLARIGIERLFDLSADPQRPVRAIKSQQNLSKDQSKMVLFALDIFADLMDSSQEDVIENLGIGDCDYQGSCKTLVKTEDESTFKVLIQLLQIARTISKNHHVNSGDQK